MVIAGFVATVLLGVRLYPHLTNRVPVAQRGGIGCRVESREVSIGYSLGTLDWPPLLTTTEMWLTELRVPEGDTERVGEIVAMSELTITLASGETFGVTLEGDEYDPRWNSTGSSIVKYKSGEWLSMGPGTRWQWGNVGRLALHEFRVFWVWFGSVLAAQLAFVAGRIRYRAFRRRCEACGYDLRSTALDTCPECGHSTPV